MLELAHLRALVAGPQHDGRQRWLGRRRRASVELVEPVGVGERRSAVSTGSTGVGCRVGDVTGRAMRGPARVRRTATSARPRADAVRRAGREQRHDDAGRRTTRRSDSPWTCLLGRAERGRPRRRAEEPDAAHSVDVRDDAEPGIRLRAARAAPTLRGVTRADLDKQPTDVRRMFDAVARATTSPTTCSRSARTGAGARTVIDAVDAAARRAGARPGRRHRYVEPAVRRPPAPSSSRATSRSACSQVGKQARPRAAVHRRRRRPGCRSPTTPSTPSRSPSGCATSSTRSAGLREMLRVTRPGGRLVVCEFSHPTWAPFRTVYVEYLMKALPADRPRRLVLARTPTSTSPSRSAPGPTSRASPR